MRATVSGMLLCAREASRRIGLFLKGARVAVEGKAREVRGLYP